MKNILLKRASAIHAVKCNKSDDFNEGIASFNKLLIIKNNLEGSIDQELPTIENEIEVWKNSNPIASEKEINKILKKK